MLSVARIDFAQMIEAAGAHSVVDAMIDRFGILEARMREIIVHSGPFFFRAHQHWMDRPGGLDELNKLVRSGGPQQFADRAGLTVSVSRQEGRTYLKELFRDEESRHGHAANCSASRHRPTETAGNDAESRCFVCRCPLQVDDAIKALEISLVIETRKTI